MIASRRDRGQATVEVALTLPVIMVLVLLIVQVGVVASARLGVANAARAAARAASVSADPAGSGTAAALRATGLRPLEVRIRAGPSTVTAQVSYVQHADIALIGALIPDVTLSAQVTMALEPP